MLIKIVNTTHQAGGKSGDVDVLLTTVGRQVGRHANDHIRSRDLMRPDPCRRDRLAGTRGATGALIAFLATAAGFVIAVVAKTVYHCFPH